MMGVVPWVNWKVTELSPTAQARQPGKGRGRWCEQKPPSLLLLTVMLPKKKTKEWHRTELVQGR